MEYYFCTNIITIKENVQMNLSVLLSILLMLEFWILKLIFGLKDLMLYIIPYIDVIIEKESGEHLIS